MRLSHPLPAPLPLQCPDCRTLLTARGRSAYQCADCGQTFHQGPEGYLNFTRCAMATTSEDYALGQEACGARVYAAFLSPYFRQTRARQVLEVGCGVGQALQCHLDAGGDGVGVDLPDLARHWRRLQRDPRRFAGCDATRLPFADASFDVVYALGVIEHIGTLNGHCTLAPDYEAQRQRFANELLRVTRPGGRVIVACPNKRFPMDIQHGPSDALTPRTWSVRLRERVYARTRINLHAPWGRSHLLSYGECRALFLGTGLAAGFRPLPLRGYFGFEACHRGALKALRALIQAYVEHLPAWLRGTALNPYLLAEIRR
ncbi:class I SAM-dependent methyltransferase [Pelomonas sp. APW6]|uniref:Class I SAM-dependent methyltransferase n=1 Tax=Roseateles subflavus TaxID=3053353 RepID=A0ABT7LJ91_9BURK|nr:class I SAM-dependent methyltransferase [Pelomonas sp. APW6]MDL5032883.1 class I SAM-dependent methyltransferase [Pelomonas sp. APW6]